MKRGVLPENVCSDTNTSGKDASHGWSGDSRDAGLCNSEDGRGGLAEATNWSEGNWSERERFKEFGLDVDGTVHSISYTNTGENTRAMSQGLQQAGMLAPMMIGMIQSQNQGGDGPDLQVVQDLLGLLPSVGRIIGKLDFIEASMAATQPSREAGTYVRHSVTLIRPPQEEKPAAVKSPPPSKSKSKSKSASDKPAK